MATEAQGPGTNVISVIVTDNGVPSLTATQIFTVVVLETNSAPVLLPIPNFIVAEGDTLTITNVATDPDLPANGLLFSLANAPTNSTINPTNGVFSWTTTEADGPGTNVIQVIVTDNGVPSLSATQSFTVIVRETNAPPSLAPITNHTIVEGETLTFTNSATDPDHGLNQLTFNLANPPTGASVGATNGVFTWTPDESQGGSTNLISVIVTDDGVPSMSATQSFTVVVLEINSAPMLAGISNYTIFEGQTLTFTNVFSDSDLPPNLLTFSLENAPTNATINPTNGVFTWTPDESQGGTSNYFSVVLTDDGVPSLSITQSFAVMVLDTNSAPLLGAISNYTIFEGQTLTITNAASDSDIPANMLVFSLQNAPTNATINPTSGVFTWTPDEAQGPCTNFISVVVADDGLPSLTATQSFTVIVLESNSAPVLAAIADFKVQVGNTLVFTNSASDSDLPANTLAYSLDPGAPLSASVGSGTGIFAWTPTDADAGTAQSVTVRVTDDGAPALFDTKTFLVSVVSRPFITSIVVNSNFVAVTWTALAGQGYRLQFNTNLAETNWVDVLPDVIASAPSATQTNAYNVAASHFYRVRLVP